MLQRHRLAAAALAAFIPTLGACRPRTDGARLQSAAVKPHDLGSYDCPAGQDKIKVAFFDADSTLRISKSGSVSANAVDDVNILPFVGRKIGALNAQGYLVAIVSNQGGVAAGHITAEIAEGALLTAVRGVKEMGGQIDYVGLAVADDDERKPKTGMAKRLDALLVEACGRGIDLAQSFMVGDSGYKKGSDGPHPDGRPADDFSNSDRLFARNLFAPGGELPAGKFHEPTDYFGWRRFGVFNLAAPGELEDMLLTIEAEAHALKASGDATASADLATEVERLRTVNGMRRGFRFVHYNIKELHTGKLIDAQDAQITTAARVLRSLGGDLVSINEIQHDTPDVPLPGFPGTGDNMRRLMERVAPPDLASWSYNLAPANTGAKAKKKPDGSYAVHPNAPGSQELADQLNFGTFPGQYSTGFATHFPVRGRTVLTDLQWTDWDATGLAAVTLPSGEAPPADMLLFDKNFNDVQVEIGGRVVHAVTFHTVPAFGFGGSADFNIARNAAQLAFLEWYLVGACDASATASKVRRCETAVKPLPADAAFIATGDLNVDLTATAAGAKVLKRLLAHDRIHAWRATHPDHLFRQDDGGKASYITYMSDGVDLGKLQSALDYFLISKDLKIHHGRVASPLSGFVEHSCHGTKAAADAATAQVPAAEGRRVSMSTRYADDGTRTYCVVSVTTEFADFRRGSDHFPVYVSLDWK